MKVIKPFILLVPCLLLSGCALLMPDQDNEKVVLQLKNGRLINPRLEEETEKKREELEDQDPNEEPEPFELDDSVRQFNSKEMNLREFPEREFQDKAFKQREMPDREFSNKELSTGEMPE